MRESPVKRVLQVLAASALVPLLTYCSSGELATSAAVATPRTAAVRGQAEIFINEILAHTDEPQVDTLELYNPGTLGVDLTGWCVSDDKEELTRYCISTPNGDVQPPVIEAGGYFLLTGPELGFAFSESGEEVILSAPENGGLQIIDRAKFGVSPNGVSMGRHVTSTGAVHFPLQSKLTLGVQNAGPLISGVVISGIAYDPVKGPEYLVLTNSSDQRVLLYDPTVPENSWQVTGIAGNGDAYRLPTQTALQPSESIILTADPAAFAATYPALNVRVIGPFVGKLNNDGERIALQAPQPPEIDGVIYYADMDVVEYGVAAPWPTIGGNSLALVRQNLRQYGNDPINWRAAPTGLRAVSMLLLPLVQR